MPHATNASVMRDQNRKLILNMIRLRPISRVELAQSIHLTRASVTQIVDELIQSGLVEEASAVGGSRGRKRVTLRLRENSQYVFGVHIGRQFCHLGITDLCGNVKEVCRRPIAGQQPEALLRELGAQIRELCASLTDAHVLGIGVCCPGPVDYRSGCILNPPDFPGWERVPICQLLSEYTGLPALLERDTNARALEEKYYGGCKDVSNFILVQIDKGVGAGVLIGDRLYRGSRGMGAEIGHTSIRFDGPLCSCGNRGCLELYLRPEQLLSGTEYTCWEEAVKARDQDVLERCAEYLAAGLVNAVNLYDLERIVLAGELSVEPQMLLELLDAKLRNRILNTDALCKPLVTVGTDFQPVRTAAMAVLWDFFQTR